MAAALSQCLLKLCYWAVDSILRQYMRLRSRFFPLYQAQCLWVFLYVCVSREQDQPLSYGGLLYEHMALYLVILKQLL